MHSDQAIYRELLESIHACRNAGLYWNVIFPWVEQNTDEIRWLRQFGSRTGSPIPEASVEELWRLYALSRVNETLLLRFQNGRADGTDWLGPVITLHEYELFMTSIGMAITNVEDFSPFYHEIVKVDQADDDDQPISVIDYYWPCLMLGDMLFSRAGVHVSGGRKHILKVVAESSTLYWAYRRKNRPHQDLSHGWGSNSQWTTSFRRDYRINGTFHYNVDGEQKIVKNRFSVDEQGLLAHEQIELLTNRCFIRTNKSHYDLFPYRDRWESTP